MSKVSSLAFVALLVGLGLSGCGGGGAEENIPGAPAAGATAPSVPTGLTATAVTWSQINLIWNASTDSVGIAGYIVYRDGAQIATVGAVNAFQNTGLAPSTDYSYAVEAVNVSGMKSGRSNEARYRTQPAPDTAAPSTPTGLNATAASSSQINLSWAAATDNVGVTGYNVYRGGMLIATLGAVTTFQNTGLNAFTTYSYAVQALDAAGNVSALSSSASATTQPVPDTTPPSTPAGLTATAVSASQINLSWSAATDNVGVTGYNVFRGGALVATLGAVTTFQNTGLTASTTYSYTIRAFDAAGNVSVPSSSVSATTQAVATDTTPPTTPTGLSAAAVSSSQINLSWTAATDNVGVTGYNVLRGGVLIATVGAVTTFQNNGLAGSTTYTYTVRAFDAAGNVSASSTSASATTQAVPDTTPPSTPTGLSATAVSSSQINLSWIAATDNVGVTGYNVFRGGTLVATLGVVTTFQNTGLAASTIYSYTVRALDASGNISAPSTSASATTQAVPDTTPPSTPTGLSATAVSSSQINLAWTAATDNIGVTGYNVFRGGLQIATLGAVTSFQNNGLTASTTYSYTVRAIDAAGNASSQSAAAGATTQASSGVISMSLVASRTSGVAPLAVVFDASNTTSPVTTRPFHDLEYRWDFGDRDGGGALNKSPPVTGVTTWSAGSRAGDPLNVRNSATGPVAAHVFETPGTYTVTLTAFDGTNTGSTTVMITVDSADVAFTGTNTICIAAASLPVAGSGGCPAGASVQQQASWPTIVSTYVRAGRRVLLKSGDVFTGPASARLSIAGPGIIGSYGTANGGKAILRTTGSSGLANILFIAQSGTPQVNDWRIMDLEFDGQSNGARQAISIDGSSNQVLFLRLAIHDIGGSIEQPCWTASAPLHDQVFLVDSTIQRLIATSSYGHGWLACASQQAVLGTLFDDSTGGGAEHMVRIEYADRAVFSHNTIQMVKTGKEMFALRGVCSNSSTCGSGEWFPGLGLTGSAAATRKVVVSGNLVKTNTYAGLQIGQVSDNDSTLIRDIIVEKNYYQNVSGGGTAVRLRAAEVTIRNELMDVSNASSQCCHYGIELDGASTGMAAANNVRIYNNTIYSASTGEFIGARVAGGASNIIVRNNLGYTPSAANLVMISGSSTNSNNTGNVGSLTTDPFTNGSGLFNSAADFRLRAGTYPINAGFATTPVFSDFFGVSRPQGGAPDIGAAEQ